MEVVRLTSINCYRLSGREKFQPNVNDYECDNQDQEIVDNSSEFIVKTVEEETLVRDSTLGCYFAGTSAIYTGNLNSMPLSRARLLGTIIHEATHFAACEVFNNESLPFAITDTVNRDIFRLVMEESAREYLMGPFDDIAGAIYQGLMDRDHPMEELIVRIPQLIAQGENIDELRTRFPELMRYYEGTFLPAVAAYAARLQNRALDGWQGG